MEFSMDDVTPIKPLKESDASSVFEALLNDKTCILKVVGFFFPLIHLPLTGSQVPHPCQKERAHELLREGPFSM